MSEDLAELIAFPRRREHDPELTYKQLGAELKVSRRFLIDRVGEGMPSRLDYAGRRVMRLSTARAFLEERNRRMGRSIGLDQEPQAAKGEP